MRGVANKKLVKLPRDTGGCWVWQGQVNSGGTPTKSLAEGDKQRVLNARRWVWETFFGKVPDGKNVLSKCGNLMCVNLGHCELGTRQEAAVARRTSKISAEDAEEIRQLYDAGVLRADIARKYDISPAQVSRIGLRRQHRKKSDDAQVHEGRRRGRVEAAVPLRCDDEN